MVEKRAVFFLVKNNVEMLVLLFLGSTPVLNGFCCCFISKSRARFSLTRLAKRPLTWTVSPIAGTRSQLLFFFVVVVLRHPFRLIYSHLHFRTGLVDFFVFFFNGTDRGLAAISLRNNVPRRRIFWVSYLFIFFLLSFFGFCGHPLWPVLVVPFYRLEIYWVANRTLVSP